MNAIDDHSLAINATTAIMAIRRIGQILVDLGFLTDDQLEMLLEEQQQRPGEMLGPDRHRAWA